MPHGCDWMAATLPLLAADPLALHWVKYGGEVYRLGLLPASMLRWGFVVMHVHVLT